MEAMGGRTGVESTQGQGSTFWIELPQVESQKELVQKAGGLLKTEIVSTSAKGTILYIEDNISNIELVEEILAVQRPDIILVSETFGKNAVKKAIGCKPDFILLDLNLPDIHGREVLAMLLTDNFTESIPVVILSADAMPHQLMKMINSGAKSYLTKPLDVQEFLKVVDQYIRI